jgi:LysM repeat protein
MLQAPRIVRWTLPALLLTLVIGGYAIVAASGREDGKPGSASPTTTTTATKKKKHHKPKRVKVHSGDTAESIASHAKLTVVELLELNPNVDPRALRPGQRLKISR